MGDVGSSSGTSRPPPQLLPPPVLTRRARRSEAILFGVISVLVVYEQWSLELTTVYPGKCLSRVKQGACH